MLKMAAPARPRAWLLIYVFLTVVQSDDASLSPIVLNTWPFTKATEAAWTKLAQRGSALDAVEVGCVACEVQQCDGTVGYGGSPAENGETTLDAAIMDGVTHDVGSVGGLRRIKNAISVARAVMTYTKHTLLVGEMATSFAKDMGFKEQDLTTGKSVGIWTSWVKNKCQPNFRQYVAPDSDTSCGPYTPATHTKHSPRHNKDVRRDNHDTIGMIAIDHLGHIAGGTSTNGANHKVPGRVGDSPIIGAGLYVDQEVGGAAATGDGDVMMRFLPSYQTVEYMRQGMTPEVAARLSIQRIAKYYPQFMGALIAIDIKKRLYGAACHGLKTFPFSVMDGTRPAVSVISVKCT